jgi:phosphoribosyl-ATP pyrophosphohydrolase
MTFEELFETIKSRKDSSADGSYTASLFQKGISKISQKVGEEGTEVVVAALSQSNERLIEEISDLTYHVMVLMAYKGLTLEDILKELESRKR